MLEATIVQEERNAWSEETAKMRGTISALDAKVFLLLL